MSRVLDSPATEFRRCQHLPATVIHNCIFFSFPGSADHCEAWGEGFLFQRLEEREKLQVCKKAALRGLVYVCDPHETTTFQSEADRQAESMEPGLSTGVPPWGTSLGLSHGLVPCPGDPCLHGAPRLGLQSTRESGRLRLLSSSLESRPDFALCFGEGGNRAAV